MTEYEERLAEIRANMRGVNPAAAAAMEIADAYRSAYTELVDAIMRGETREQVIHRAHMHVPRFKSAVAAGLESAAAEIKKP